MKRLVLCGGVCAALIAPALLATAGAQTGPPTGTLDLVQLEREVRTGFVDAAPRRRESAGDVFTIQGRVRDGANRPTGTAYATFTQTGRRSAQGSATFVLADGRIVVAGALAGGGGDALAIIGGTGAYAGATGTAQVTEGPSRTAFRFTFGG